MNSVFEQSADSVEVVAPEPMTWLVGLTEYAGVTRYTGGIGTHYAALLAALAQQGHVIHVVLFTDETIDKVQLPRNIHLVGIHGLRRIPRSVQPLARAVIFRRHWSSSRYNAVFVPEWAGVAALLPRRAPLITNLATGLRLGDWIASRTNADLPLRMRLSRWVQDALETRQIRRSRGLVPISRAVLKWNETHLKHLPPSLIVGNCVDVAAITSLRHAAELPEGWPAVPADSPVILFVGRLEVRKGVTVTTAAFSELLAAHPDARLVLCGASGDSRFEPTRQQLLDRVPEAFRDHVTFLGHLGSEPLLAAMRAATLVACPSLWEGFGNVALEVKAAGVPLIVTSGSGYDGFCTDEGDCLVVPPGDSAALANAFARLIDSPELRERLVLGGETSVEQFTPHRIAEVTSQAVRVLAERNGAQ
jgi:glycogen(starch) synthase